MEEDRALTQKHYDCLDGLRAVLALYVVLHHCWLGAFLVHPDLVSRWFLVLSLGRYAVCFFIVLSGFCLALPTLSRGYRLTAGIDPFLQRRAWRILPPYYAALALSIAVDLPLNHRTGPVWDVILPVTGANVLSHLLLVHNFLPSHTYTINGAFWSIPVEWQIYFVFPLLLLGWRHIGPFALTALAVVLSLGLELAITARFDREQVGNLQLLKVGINDQFNRQPCVHFIGLFALGMLAAFIGRSANFRRFPWRLVMTGLWVAFAVALDEQAAMMKDLFFGLVAAVTLIVMFVHPHGWLHRGLDWKPLVFIGSFSYSIYLVHLPLLLLLWVLLVAPLDDYPNFACLLMIFAGTPVIVAASYLFHLGFEKPFLNVRARHVVHVP